MKKNIKTFVALILIFTSVLFPGFQPSQGDNTVQPLNGWQLEWW